MSSKGVCFRSECVLELCANSSIGRFSDQEDGFPVQYMDRYVEISWLKRSVVPSDWGWYADEKDCVTPRRFMSAWMEFARKRGSRSEMILSGSPNRV